MKTENLFEKAHLNPAEGFHIRPFSGENTTLLHIRLEAGKVAPRHNHIHEQLTLVVSGELEYELEGEVRVLTAGEVVFVPSNAFHSAKALTDTIVIEAFSPARTDLMEKLAALEGS
ncbi:cupin domain-containing protein [Deinococcus misasensis]|uniref:cupin domain-containing protein n=1 Tax=Deinococcus misasensis TaxID=392413 RepID=UPI000550114E|nr:cupin domain-containing protein [Deinococcus misasensis]